MTYFSRLTLSGWRQFEAVEIDLNNQITIITGQNGSGKTTILNTLGHHFGWNVNFVSTPYLGKKTAKRLWSDIFGSLKWEIDENTNTEHQIGEIHYDTGGSCRLTVQTQVSSQYKPNYQNQQNVPGLHIPSHRPAASYNNIPSIPTNPKTALQYYQNYQNLLNQLYGSGKAENPGKIQKESIISLATFGEGNSHVQSNPEFVRILDGFQRVLKEVLPVSIGFERLEIRMPEVVFITRSGEFALDAMSGGISALFSIAWQIYMFGIDKDACTVTIDEPENHLHPTMQRSFLPALAAAFPNYRIIIASHSPFVVTSFPAANVYGLVHSPQNKIVSRKIDTHELSGTPNKILREILDVESNLPMWVERKIDQIMKETESLSDKERASRILKQLEELGISDALPDLKENE